MVSQKSIGLLDRRLKILAGLQSRPAGVRSRLVPRRQEQRVNAAHVHGRRPTSVPV